MSRPARRPAFARPGADLEQLRLITRAARMHHIEGARQTEIAERLGISQAGVSRLLRQAEEEGIVRMVVVPPEGLFPDLEDGLARAFGLEAAFVADIAPGGDGIARDLGAAAAGCLAPWLGAGPVIGFTSWSTTLREMAGLIGPRAAGPVRAVVETLGDLGSPRQQHEADVATLRMAEALGAEAVFLRAPGVLHSAGLKEAVLEDAHVARAIRALDRADTVFVGIGPADFHGPLGESGSFFTARQLAEAREAGAVGQLHQRFIDAEGRAVATPLDDLVVGMTLGQLRAAGRRIAVAGGRAKHAALAAALAGRWIDVLVTDPGTAEFLLSAAREGGGA